MIRRSALVPLEGTIPARLDGPALPESAAQPASMVVTVDGEARQVLTQARTRLVVVGAVFAMALLAVAVRLADLAILGGNEPGAQAHVAPPAAKPVRADILDRNGSVLATSIATASLFADPAKVIDRATYADPFQYNEGIEHVVVNGQLVLDHGKPTGDLPGRALRRGL